MYALVHRMNLKQTSEAGVIVNELTQALIGDSAAAPPAHILEGVNSELAHEALPFAPHTI